MEIWALDIKHTWMQQSLHFRHCTCAHSLLTVVVTVCFVVILSVTQVLNADEASKSESLILTYLVTLNKGTRHGILNDNRRKSAHL